LLILACAAAPRTVVADTPIELTPSPATLTLTSAWQARAHRDSSAIVVVYQHTSGPTMVVHRVAVPGISAWRRAEREGFVDEIVSGLLASAPSLTLQRRRLVTTGAIPALDLHLARDDQQVLMRMLFFRTYTLTAVAALPAKVPANLRKQIESALDSFAVPTTPR
jgi:hypothetical protein